MFDDEAPKPSHFQPRVLDPLSLEELDSYISELEAEIKRCKDAIVAKKDQRGAANALFSGLKQ